MPSHDDHLRQAQHNLEFSASLDETKYADWIANGLFYAALHYVDAFLATRGYHPGRHDVRDGFVEKVAELKPIYDYYRGLKDGSRNARYYCPPGFSKPYVQQLRNHLEQIRAHLRTHIPIP